MSIYTDQEAFGSIKEASRPIYVKNWEDFLKIVPEFDKESGKPTEDMVIKFVKYLRLEKKCASSGRKGTTAKGLLPSCKQSCGCKW